jgi:hypothetical protein
MADLYRYAAVNVKRIGLGVNGLLGLYEISLVTAVVKIPARLSCEPSALPPQSIVY